MSILFHVPKMQMAVILFCIYLTALFHTPSFAAVITLLTSLISAVFADFIFLKLRKKQFFFPSAAIVTGLIVALLTAPSLPWYEPITTSVLAIACKNFLRISDRYVFNPAALGVFIVSLFFNHTVSWWAVSWQQIFPLSFESIFFFIILLSPAIISIKRIRRWRIVIAFFLFPVLFNPAILLDPTTIFFMLVMLPEPMTSPNRHSMQIPFGISVALIATIMSLPFFAFLPDVYIFALLIANIFFFKLR